ncbi:ATP synthase subunit A [Medicago truncatula]|uniref:F-ATPase protein 6 n=1 Tax=Medicago truncatula TaxID=3880 RepID=A0A072TFY0_MEDTR|nr:ATP synthase subunit A [Medicago truncatula]
MTITNDKDEMTITNDKDRLSAFEIKEMTEEAERCNVEDKIISRKAKGMIPYSFTVTSHFLITLGLSFSIFIGITIVALLALLLADPATYRNMTYNASQSTLGPSSQKVL